MVEVNNYIYNNLKYLGKIKTYKIYANSILENKEGILDCSNTPEFKYEIEGCINIVKSKKIKEQYKNNLGNVISGELFTNKEIKQGDLIEKDNVKYTIRYLDTKDGYIYIYAS